MKIIVAVSGASGSIYARLLLARLSACAAVESVAVVCSDNALRIAEHELSGPLYDKACSKLVPYANTDLFAPMASGSSGYDAMVVVPASMGAVGRMAGGISDDLISRAADVMLKERRKLIVVFREMPLSYIHLQNLSALTLAGAVVLPAAPAFYALPEDMEGLCNSVVDKIFQQLALTDEPIFRWTGGSE